MLKNHLKIAFRYALNNRGYTAINLLGLVVGLTSFIIILLYVNDELSFDKFHKDAEQIHKVTLNQNKEGNNIARLNLAGPLKKAMSDEIPEVELATHLLTEYSKTTLSNSTYTYNDNVFYFVDSSFLDIFSFPFVEGNSKTAFSDPASIVLTESMAKRFFGYRSALGQVLTFGQNKSLKVTGVIKEISSQTHFQFDFLVSTAISRRAGSVSNWGEGHYHTYIKVNPLAAMPEVNRKIQNITDIHQAGYMKESQLQETYATIPIGDIHLTRHTDELTASGNNLYIQVLSLLALFILLIAGINYVNLTTARSALRSKEIGLRKMVGIFRKTLIFQFLTESVLIVFITGILAVGLTTQLLPLFNDLMQKNLSLLTSDSLLVWGFLLLAILIFGVMAGIYPAFYLSGFNPTTNLKNKGGLKGKGINLRKGLVILQFSLSAFLLIGMLVVKRQINYIQSADLGFDKEQILIVNNFYKIPKIGDPNSVIRNAIRDLNGVVDVGGNLEGSIGTRGQSRGTVRLNPESPSVASLAQLVDDRYLDVFDLKIIAGRNFIPELEHLDQYKMGDSRIINEMAVKQMEIKGDPIGQKIGNSTIVGVVKDFHSASLHNEILPYVFIYTPNAQQISIKLSGVNLAETMAQIEGVLKEFVPNVPMDYYFLDSAIDQQYMSEKNFNWLFSTLTILALLVACLGLFGLAAYTTEQRSKEIGIRKVLGASVRSVVSLLSKDFVKLVLIANIIAWPISWFAMNSWLENFAYRTSFSLSIFLIAGAIAIIIAVLAVSWQTLRAAIANPIDSLKNE